ncbi:hypothetical protein EBB07_25965 [Paenibacillaceae bacterium]|nr:hypothetical protein EBB07_25965 [Paenibacillaceae bacterium]
MSTLSLSASSQLTNWSVANPFYGSPNFNTANGNYIVPVTGRYSIVATINYATTIALTAAIGPAVNPFFIVQRTSPTVTGLVTGLLPVLNVNILLLLTLRVVLGSAVVTLAGEVALSAGDVVGLYYNASGLTVTINIGSGAANGVVWAMHRLT